MSRPKMISSAHQLRRRLPLTGRARGRVAVSKYGSHGVTEKMVDDRDATKNGRSKIELRNRLNN